MFGLADERDLVLEKMGIAVGGFRFCCYIALGSVAAFSSALSLHFLRLRFYISLCSVVTLYWVRTLHLLRFGWYIAVGSDGPLKDWDLWV